MQRLQILYSQIRTLIEFKRRRLIDSARVGLYMSSLPRESVEMFHSQPSLGLWEAADQGEAGEGEGQDQHGESPDCWGEQRKLR